MNIIHRDLKLENLVLQEPNKIETIKLIDFGLAIPTNTSIR
jgi:calcium/calmodulin-dependent protein kinase I